MKYLKADDEDDALIQLVRTTGKVQFDDKKLISKMYYPFGARYIEIKLMENYDNYPIRIDVPHGCFYNRPGWDFVQPYAREILCGYMIAAGFGECWVCTEQNQLVDNFGELIRQPGVYSYTWFPDDYFPELSINLNDLLETEEPTFHGEVDAFVSRIESHLKFID